MASFHVPELDTPFVFTARPEPVPSDLRPNWRISVILLILRIASRGSKSSFGRLHVLNWAIRTQENQETLIKIIGRDISPDTVVVRIEPFLNRAVNLANGEGLVERVSGDRIQLTSKGISAADMLRNQEVFIDEQRFLEFIGKALTEQTVDHLFSRRQ